MINEANKGGVKSRIGLYAYVSKHTKEAIDCLYKLMEESRNEGIKLGAAKALLDKSLPDIKAVDINSQQTEPLIVRVIAGADYMEYEKKRIKYYDNK